MAAERTPSRRKQCIFRRTFQRFPFGKCERRCRSSSYDVHHADVSPSKTSEKWSPTERSVSGFSVHQAGHRGGVERAASNNNAQPANTNIFNGGYEGDVELEPVSTIRVSELPPSPHMRLAHPHIHAMQSHRDVERPDTDSAYSSMSYRGEQHQHEAASPPSPSISSMETDVGVDPETGERAME